MSFSKILFIITFTWVASIDRSQCGSSVPEPVIGQSACFLKGNVDYNQCKLKTILCDELPAECTSYFWSSAYISVKDFSIYDPFGPENDAYFKQLLQCTQKPIYVRYGYFDILEWGTVFKNNGNIENQVLKEINSLNIYLESHPMISGLMLSNLDVDTQIPIYANFSQTLCSYIEAYKKFMNTPKLQIGLYLYADSMMDYYQDPKSEWINFKTVPFDFIVIAFNYLNGYYCTPKFKNIGMEPLTGNVGRTVVQFQDVLDKIQIPKEKLYFRYSIYPTDKVKSTYCTVSTELMCLNRGKALDWCSDTIASYHAKGKYACAHAAGFVAAHVDKDDSDNKCECCPYPAFNAILDGFNDKDVPPSCAGIDRYLYL